MGLPENAEPRGVLPNPFYMCPHCTVHRVWERQTWKEAAKALVTLWWCYHCSWEGTRDQAIACNRHFSTDAEHQKHVELQRRLSV